MPQVPLHVAVDDPAVVAGLSRIRADYEVPRPHPPEVVAAARDAAGKVLAQLDDGSRYDARAIEFVTIDPAGSRDLDQALHIERRSAGDGWRVRYAIADVAAFVAAGGSLDTACWERGVTYYLPDGRAPLHPDVLGEGAASLLPEQDRAAVLWTVDLSADGEVGATSVTRAVVRSRAQLTYQQVQADVDAGTASETLQLLEAVGEARLRQEESRGGVSLDLPSQHVEADDGGYRIDFETTVPSMTWNAQVSLLVGMVAAARMLDADVGLLRTMPPPSASIMGQVKHTARALRIDWPHGASYAEMVGKLDGSKPDDAAVLALASRGLRGAGYVALPPEAEIAIPLDHAAVAAPYAHVTAPLRRLGDRYAAEACLAIERGDRPPDWVLERLGDLPDALRSASGREAAAAHAVLDLVEALVLRNRVGQTLAVTIVAADHDAATVVCRDPAIRAKVHGRDFKHRLGEEILVRVEAADPAARKIILQPLPTPSPPQT